MLDVVDDVECAVDGTAALFDDGASLLSEIGAEGGVIGEFEEAWCEFVVVGESDGGVRVLEDVVDLSEVFEVWAVEDGFGEDGGFDDVVSAGLSGGAFSDEGDVGGGEDVHEFAGGVDDEDVDGSGGVGAFGVG